MKTNPNEPIQADPARASQSTFSNQDPLSLPSGLTKREHFAALAMQGYISADYTANSGLPHSELSKWSVGMADALIEALNNDTP